MTAGYRRRILIVSSGRTVEAAMEDDFHHFRVVLEHDGRQVTTAGGGAVRYPWSTCPGAVDKLAELAGMPLSTRLTAAGDYARPRQHCTHLFDLAGLAVAQAARGEGRRQYDAEVPDRHGASTVASLRRDGDLALEWRIEDNTIVEPPRFAGTRLRGAGGFMRWAETSFDAETAEAAIVLRRAVEISNGRSRDLDALPGAWALAAFMEGSCYTFQSGRVEQAVRVRGSAKDFSAQPDALLAADPLRS